MITEDSTVFYKYGSKYLLIMQNEAQAVQILVLASLDIYIFDHHA